jgi:hypothetical protein
MNEQELQKQASHRVAMKMGFLIHLTVFVAVNGGLWLMGLWSDWTGLGPHHGFRFVPIWGWALGLTIHGIVTLVKLQGWDLRQRMMKSEVERLRQRESH